MTTSDLSALCRILKGHTYFDVYIWIQFHLFCLGGLFLYKMSISNFSVNAKGVMFTLSIAGGASFYNIPGDYGYTICFLDSPYFI